MLTLSGYNNHIGSAPLCITRLDTGLLVLYYTVLKSSKMSSGNEQEYSLLCLGCGEDLKDRSDDRRALQGSVEAERVWRDLLEMVQFDVDEDRLCTDNMMSEII